MGKINHLRSYRAKERMTLGQLGELFGVNRSTVMRWEQGKIPPERVMPISRATGIPPHVLRPDVFADPVEANT